MLWKIWKQKITGYPVIFCLQAVWAIPNFEIYFCFIRKPLVRLIYPHRSGENTTCKYYYITILMILNLQKCKLKNSFLLIHQRLIYLAISRFELEVLKVSTPYYPSSAMDSLLDGLIPDSYLCQTVCRARSQVYKQLESVRLDIFPLGGSF